MKYLLVAVGGGTGAVLRYLLSRGIGGAWNGSFPLGTFVVNASGCLAIGALSAVFEHFVLQPEWRLFLVVGILGGFTTFSSFSLETFQLFREREIDAAVANLLLSNVVGVGMVAAGYFGVRWCLTAWGGNG